MKLIHTAMVVALSASLAACIVAPPGYYGEAGGHATVSVTAPAPYYAAPAVGYLWLNHVSHGWGWRHPHRGWHRGWR